MAFKSKGIFINLPVKDVNKSTDFFQAAGFEFNPQFSSEDTSCLIISDNIVAFLLAEDRFKEFAKKDIADTTNSSEAILCLSAESREQVDELVNKAFEAGGKPSNTKQDYGFTYVWGFQDIDGHLWEVTYMDESPMNQG